MMIRLYINKLSPAKHFLVWLVVMLHCLVVNGQSLKLAAIFGDKMVLQREKQVPVWGNSKPNDMITVSFDGQTKKVQSGPDGRWMIKLDPLEASFQGQNMVISGDTEVVIKDILVGEVWICSGQSNMQMGIASIPEIRGLVPMAKNIRSFTVDYQVAFEEQENVSGQWRSQHPNSAVAFSFAYFLQNLADVPIGIIQSSWGSSSIEAWMPRSMVNDLPHFQTIMNEFDADKARKDRVKKYIAKSSWTNSENIFLRRQPNILYNAMMHPLIPFACRGLLWYQGERNTRYLSGMPEINENNWFHRVGGMKEYNESLQKWILTYRQRWHDPNMHFMVVMLPGFGKGVEEKKVIDPENPSEPSWAWMRESQLASLKLADVSLINTIDLGDLKNIHPTDKLPIGQRAALMAANRTLNMNVTALGPTLTSVVAQNGQLVVSFDHAEGLKTTNGKAPSGFWVTDDSNEWLRADAQIIGETVILTSSEIKNPKFVRYAFAGKPTVNLVNKYELPAYPFRTDTWEK